MTESAKKEVTVNNAEAWRDLYPFESNFMDIDGNRLHYLDEGDKDSDAIVMVHGNPTWSFYFRNLVCELRKNFRVIVIDHLGCGLSDKPQDYNYCLENHVNNLTALLNDHLNLQKISLVVHDWGGAIGMGYATANLQKIQKITILNTAAFLSKNCPFRIKICKLPIFGNLAIRGFNAFAKSALSMATNLPNGLDSKVKAGLIFPYDSYRNRIATLRFVQDIPLKPQHPTWQVLTSIQKKLHLLKDKPIQICWGAKDFCFNDTFLQVWKQYFPAANITVYEDAGHYVLEDAKEEIVPKICHFLTS